MPIHTCAQCGLAFEHWAIESNPLARLCPTCHITVHEVSDIDFNETR